MAQARYDDGVWPGFALGFALLWRTATPSPARTGVTALTLTLLAIAFVALAGAGCCSTADDDRSALDGSRVGVGISGLAGVRPIR